MDLAPRAGGRAMTAAFDYGKSRDTADRLIAKFGQAIAVRRASVTGGSAWEPTQSTTDYQTKAAQVDLTWAQRQDSSINTTDQRWLVSAGRSPPLAWR